MNDFVGFVRRKTQVIGSERNIFVNRFFKKLIFGVLKHNPHFAADFRKIYTLLRNILAVYVNFTAVRLDKPVKMLDKRGFSRTRVPYNAHKIAVGYFKTDVIERGLFKRRAF